MGVFAACGAAWGIVLGIATGFLFFFLLAVYQIGVSIRVLRPSIQGIGGCLVVRNIRRVDIETAQVVRVEVPECKGRIGPRRKVCEIATDKLVVRVLALECRPGPGIIVSYSKAELERLVGDLRELVARN